MCLKRQWVLPLVILGLSITAGCPQKGSHQKSISTPSAVESKPAPADELKMQLQSLANDGAMFPGSETIGDNIQAVKATDPEKGAALEKDFEDLKGSLGNPAQVKTKAKAMLDKLGPAAGQ